MIFAQFDNRSVRNSLKPLNRETIYLGLVRNKKLFYIKKKILLYKKGGKKGGEKVEEREIGVKKRENILFLFPC